MRTGTEDQEVIDFYEESPAWARELLDAAPSPKEMAQMIVELESGQFDMEVWVNEDCGTSACMAGWGIKFAGLNLGEEAYKYYLEDPRDDQRKYATPMMPTVVGAYLFGLTLEEANEVFQMTNKDALSFMEKRWGQGEVLLDPVLPSLPMGILLTLFLGNRYWKVVPRWVLCNVDSLIYSVDFYEHPRQGVERWMSLLDSSPNTVL